MHFACVHCADSSTNSSYSSPPSTNHMIIWLILWFIICIPLIPPPLTFHQLLDLSSWHVKHQHNTNTTVNEHKEAQVSIFFLSFYFFVSFFTGFSLLHWHVRNNDKWPQPPTPHTTTNAGPTRHNDMNDHKETGVREVMAGGSRCVASSQVCFFFFFFFFFTNIYLLCTAITSPFLYPTTTTAGLETHQTCFELWNFFFSK